MWGRREAGMVAAACRGAPCSLVRHTAPAAAPATAVLGTRPDEGRQAVLQRVLLPSHAPRLSEAAAAQRGAGAGGWRSWRGRGLVGLAFGVKLRGGGDGWSLEDK
ncbi:hypothetical protein PLESTM_001185800 [Pleodorina starrii]|nr:hypothetical protein PLESTM_001185800 [Pleodorina starrii]